MSPPPAQPPAERRWAQADSGAWHAGVRCDEATTATAAIPRVDRQALLRRVRALPPLPRAWQALLAALRQDGGPPLGRCAALIERDQALTAALLRLANSAFYGMPGRVLRVDDALHLIGLRQMAALAGAQALQQALRPEACAGFDFEAYWRHALLSALLARVLAAQEGSDGDAAFLAGLMHPLGRLVLASLLPEPTAEVLALVRSRCIMLDEAERVVLGFSHRPLGAMLLAHWRFPETVVQAVAAAERPEPAAAAPEQRLARLVQTSSRIASGLLADAEAGTPLQLPVTITERACRLGLSPEASARLLAEVEAAMRAVSAA